VECRKFWTGVDAGVICFSWAQALRPKLSESFQGSCGKVRRTRWAADSRPRQQPPSPDIPQPATRSLSPDALVVAKTRRSSQPLCGKFFRLSSRLRQLFYTTHRATERTADLQGCRSERVDTSRMARQVAKFALDINRLTQLVAFVATRIGISLVCNHASSYLCSRSRGSEIHRPGLACAGYRLDSKATPEQGYSSGTLPGNAAR